MSLWRGAKRTAKYVVVDMPAGIFGWNFLKAGNGFIGSLWKSLTYPSCPECDGGLLVPKDKEEVLQSQPNGKTERLVPWCCHRCAFQLFAPRDLRAATTTAQNLRNARVQDVLHELDQRDRDTLARSHAYQSRGFFGVSALTLAGCVYMIAIGASWLTAFQWALIAGMLWIFGMKKSYRAWQARTGTIFQRGSLWRWFRDAKWLV